MVRFSIFFFFLPVFCLEQAHGESGCWDIFLQEIVRPCLVLRQPHLQLAASFSGSSFKPATALEERGQPGQHLTASGKVRKEVPLPSQEKKEGAMQYVLSVSLD